MVQGGQAVLPIHPRQPKPGAGFRGPGRSCRCEYLSENDFNLIKIGVISSEKV